MPALVLVATLLISGMVLGVQKVQLAYAAGTLARSLARGDDTARIAKRLGVEFAPSFDSEYACAIASAQTWLLKLEQKSCALKLGL
jgi:hypothetical protein